MTPPALRGILLCCLGTLLLACTGPVFGSHIDETVPGIPPPLHPSAVTTVLDGQTLPVVTVSGQSPRVLKNEKLVGVGKDPQFALRRARQFGAGRVTIEQFRGIVVTGVTTIMNTSATVAQRSLGDECRMEVTADRDLAACFVAVMFSVPPEFAGTALDKGEVLIFQAVGDLKAGVRKEVVVDLGMAPVLQWARYQYFPIFFSAGQEIRSGFSDQIATYGRHTEIRRHAAMLANYLEKNIGQDQPFRMYSQPQPIFGSPEERAALPADVKVTLTFGPEGTVTDIQSEPEIADAAARRSLFRALAGWLALPRLKQGEATSSTLVVPIHFGPKA